MFLQLVKDTRFCCIYNEAAEASVVCSMVWARIKTRTRIRTRSHYDQEQDEDQESLGA